MKKIFIPVLLIFSILTNSCKDPDKNEIRVIFDQAEGVYYGNIHDTKSGNYVIELSKDDIVLRLDLFSHMSEDPANAYPYTGTYEKGSLVSGEPGTFIPGSASDTKSGSYILIGNMVRFITSGEVTITNENNEYNLYIELYDNEGFKIKAYYNGMISYDDQHVPLDPTDKYAKIHNAFVNYYGDDENENNSGLFILYLENEMSWGENVVKLEGYMTLPNEGDEITLPKGEYTFISGSTTPFSLIPGYVSNNNPHGSYFYKYDEDLKDIVKIVLINVENVKLEVSKEGSIYTIIVNLEGENYSNSERETLQYKYVGEITVDDQSERDPNPPGEDEGEGEEG